MHRLASLKFSRKERYIVFAVIAICYLLFPNPRPDFTVFNSHDSGSYLALSHNLIEGQGYTRNINGDFIPHTLWPPGMPLILSPAVVFSGDKLNWYFVKYTMISFSLLALFILWKLVFRLTKNDQLANFTVLIFSLNPYFWHFSRVALAESIVFLWIIASLWLIDHYWRDGKTTLKQAAIIGVICGAGMMIKGVVIGLALVPFCYAIKHWRDSKKRFPEVKPAAVFFIAFFLLFALWSARNSGIDRTGLGLDGVNQIQMLFKTVVEDPTSRYRTLPEMIQTAKENVLWHGIYNVSKQMVPTAWNWELKTMVYGKYLSLAILLLAFALSLPKRFESLILWVVLSPIIVLMLLMVIGGAERYWLTISQIVSLAILINWSKWLFPSDQNHKNKIISSAGRFLYAGFAVIGLSLYITDFEKSPYNPRDDYPSFGEFVMSLQDYCRQDETLVVNTKNPYAFYFITGCEAPMANDYLGIHPDYNATVQHKSLLKTQVAAEQIIHEHQGWYLLRGQEPK